MAIPWVAATTPGGSGVYPHLLAVFDLVLAGAGYAFLVYRRAHPRAAAAVACAFLAVRALAGAGAAAIDVALIGVLLAIGARVADAQAAVALAERTVGVAAAHLALEALLVAAGRAAVHVGLQAVLPAVQAGGGAADLGGRAVVGGAIGGGEALLALLAPLLSADGAAIQIRLFGVLATVFTGDGAGGDAKGFAALPQPARAGGAVFVQIALLAVGALGRARAAAIHFGFARIQLAVIAGHHAVVAVAQYVGAGVAHRAVALQHALLAGGALGGADQAAVHVRLAKIRHAIAARCAAGLLASLVQTLQRRRAVLVVGASLAGSTFLGTAAAAIASAVHSQLAGALLAVFAVDFRTLSRQARVVSPQSRW